MNLTSCLIENLGLQAMLRDNQKGAALVEFGIILVPILLLLSGMIEFGLIAYNKQVITNASREGARWAIVQPFEAPWRNSSSVEDIVEDYWTKNALISFESGIPITPITEIRDVISNAVLTTGSEQNVCAIATPPYKDILIQVTYQYEFLFFDTIVRLFGVTQNDTISISSFTIMRCEEALPSSP